MDRKEELNWINCVKAICIILVYFAHSVSISGSVIPDWLYWLYDPVYVNAFFFVSGYLLFRKQLSQPLADESRKEYVQSGGRKMLSNIFFRIIVPSIIFAVVEYWPKHIIKGGGLSVVSFLTETVGGGTYWFVSALAVAQLLFLLLLLTRSRNIWFYVACSMVFVVIGMAAESSGLTIIDVDPSFPWKYKQGMVCTLFLAAGGVYREYEGKLGLPVGLLILLAFAYLAGSIRHSELMTGYSAYNCQVTPSGFVWSILGIICLIGVCKRLPEWRLLTFIGRNSILFYMMSGSLPFVIIRLVPFVSRDGIISVFITMVVSLAISGLLSALIVKYLPFIKDLRTLK